MNNWIVRIILAVLVVEAGVCVAFLADDWRPLRHGEEDFFETLLTATRKDREFVLDDVQPVTRVRIVRPLERGSMQPYFHVNIDEESKEILESYPPSPVDWHLLLKHMNEVGCQVAAIEQPLTWEGDDFFHLHRLRTLDKSLALFEVAVLTVDLRRLPPGQNQPIPEYLRRSAIPIENVRGQLGPLVRVDGVIHPPSASSAPNVRFSFRIQESLEGARPEFVRWDDYLIPSFPLAIAMAQHKVPPDQVQIDLGRHIRLGDGPIVPIDEIGQLSEEMSIIDRPQRAGIPAHLAVLESEIPQAKKSVGDHVPRCALFTNAIAGNSTPWTNHNQLQQIVSSFDILPRPIGVETHQRLSIFSELALLGLIAVLAALFMSLKGVFRHLSFLVLTAALLAIVVVLLLTSQKWTPLTPVLATALVGWILAIRLARYLPPRHSAPAK